MSGALAELEQALVYYTVERLQKEFGFHLVSVPDILPGLFRPQLPGEVLNAVDVVLGVNVTGVLVRHLFSIPGAMIKKMENVFLHVSRISINLTF